MLDTMHANIPQLSPQARSIRLGVYEHFRTHDRYRVLGIARNEATLEEAVVYQLIADPRVIWTRPPANFMENVYREDGAEVPRFAYISEDISH